MKNMLLGMLVTLIAVAQGYGQTKLSVTVTNIKEQKGSVRVGLFNTKDNFLKDAIDGKIIKVTGPEVTVTFDNLKPGNYAVSAIHDENENTELDKNGIGIPKEGFGFSNNKMGTFGPPSFNDAHIELPATKSISIKLKYM
jgi:uncharacterized protein (DUF2141 family)